MENEVIIGSLALRCTLSLDPTRCTVTRNLAEHVDSSSTAAVVTFQISCTVGWSGEEETAVCSNMTMESGHSKYIELVLEGDLKDSVLNFTDLSLMEFTLNLTRMGTVRRSQINAPFVQNRFVIHSTSTLGFYEAVIVGPSESTQSAVEMVAAYPSRFESSSFEGRFNISGEGIYSDSTFNASGAGLVSIALGENGVWERNDLWAESANATLSLFGRSSGYIDGKSSEHLNVICKSSDPQQSCDGLILDVPPFEALNGSEVTRHRAFLECFDYGCTNMTVIGEHGIDDIAVTAFECDCGPHGANGESGASCIGVMNIQCGGGEATFDGETCSGYTGCCGMIEQETHAAVCHAVSGSSGLSNGEVVGVMMGLIIAVLLITSLACYCSNQQAIRQQFKRTQRANPYTRSIVDDGKVKLQSSKGSRAKATAKAHGGYGAVSDDEAAGI